MTVSRWLVVLVLLGALRAEAAPPPVSLVAYASGFSAPVEITHAGDGSGRLFVVEQAGRIRVVRAGVVQAAPYLDIRSLVLHDGEQGLLGLAFHPRFAANGFLYVFYNRPLSPPGAGSEIVVARYRALDADRADPLSGAIVLVVPHAGASNHNGGQLAFGPDGLLYIAVGDGGGSGDPFNAAANLADLRGKILRIDVDAGAPYAIPAGNPFAGQAGRRGEVYLYGLRNPWRFSFDRATGDLFVADVGQGAWEEVSHIPAAQVAAGGFDLGWSRWEGNHCYPPASTSCTATANMLFPVLEYGRALGQSVTGGYRYRGRRFPELAGFYLYGDFGSGRIWAAEPAATAPWTTTQVATLANLSTFGEDEEGEVYAANIGTGAVVRLAPVDTDGDGMSDAFEARHFGGATAANAAADSDGDGVPNGVEYLERLDPRAKDNDVLASARLFAMQQYRDFLGREADAGGLAFWESTLDGGLASRSRMVTQFHATPEFANGLVAARMYFAYFRRIPDYGGLNFWIGYLLGGGSAQAMSDFFAGSPEFGATYGALDDGAFVDLVYRNVLGRPADPGGRAFWTAELQSGRRSRGGVMLQFSESPEFTGLIAHEVFVAMTYARLLRREADPSGFSHWVQVLDAGTAGESLVASFLGSPEYRARFLP